MQQQQGSIVFVIASLTRELLPLGIFTSEYAQQKHATGTTIYQAAVLWQALEELKRVHIKDVKDLKPLTAIVHHSESVTALIAKLEKRRMLEITEVELKNQDQIMVIKWFLTLNIIYS